MKILNVHCHMLVILELHFTYFSFAAHPNLLIHHFASHPQTQFLPSNNAECTLGLRGGRLADFAFHQHGNMTKNVKCLNYQS